MAEEAEWLERLRAAVALIEAAVDAPAWLVATMRVALARGDALAPAPDEVPQPPEFFYPH